MAFYSTFQRHLKYLVLESLPTDIDAGFDCLFEDSMIVRYLSSLVCFASLLLLAMSWEQFRAREEYEAQQHFFFFSECFCTLQKCTKMKQDLAFASKEVKG